MVRVGAAALLGTLVAACGSSTKTAPVLRADGWETEAALPLPADRRVPAFEITDVLASDGSAPWVAVGIGHPDSSSRAPLWWTSPDGRTWTPGGLAVLTADGPASGLEGVSRSGDTTTVVGEAFSGVHGNSRPILWRSVGGGPLTEVPITRETFGGPRAVGVDGVSIGPGGAAGGFLVAGSYIVGGTWTGPGSRLAAQVWRSTDGGEWTRVDGQEALASTPSEELLGVSVAARPGGPAVLAGNASPIGSAAPGPPTGALWRSADGLAWKRVDPAAAAMGGGPSSQLASVVAGPKAFVAAGVITNAGRSEPAIWTSADGGSWQRAAAADPAPAGAVVRVLDLAVTATRMWLVWSDGGVVRLASSPDGRHWVDEPLPPLPVIGRWTPVAVAAGGGAVELFIGTDTTPVVVRHEVAG